MIVKGTMRRVTGARLGTLVPAMLLLASVLALALGGCNGMFFQPNRRLYVTPQQLNLSHQDVEFRSADGTWITGWFLPGSQPVRGTVIHFHGNAANISNHIMAVRWLPPAGYSVLVFDYRGYGASQGSPSREGAIADGAAAINFVRTRKDVDPTRLIVYGQSLGGALAVNALAAAGTAGVQALVLEGGFVSYQELVRLKMHKSWLLWAFQYPVAYGLFSDDMSPAEVLPELADVPLLVVHGAADGTVPIEAGRQLYDAFPGGDKEMWVVPNARHMKIFHQLGSPWHDKLLEYLDGKVKTPRR